MRACSLKKNVGGRTAGRFANLSIQAAAESEVTEENADDAKAAPKRGRGRKAKPGPPPTMQLEELTMGAEYKGTVVSVTDFGAFVNIGCHVDGLLHISQISNDFVKNVADAVAIGQEVNVRVLNVDTESKKFSLTAKSADDATGLAKGERPRQARVKKERKEKPKVPVKAGETIKGAITSVAPFGIFIDVGNGYQGMLHSSQMKLPEGVTDHLSHFKEGEEIEARVANVNREKISLTQLTDEEIAAEEQIRTRGLSTGMFVCF